MKRTKIEYLTHTWNPIAMRCTPVSSGCANCWHLRMADRLAANPRLPASSRSAYAGGVPALIEKRLEAPIRHVTPAVIGVQFMGDLFHPDIPADYIQRVFSVMRRASQHTFVVLTKRPEWLARRSNYRSIYIPPNVAAGVSISVRDVAADRIEWLLGIHARIRFLSLEPLFEIINLEPWLKKRDSDRAAISGVIAGGESGPCAAPVNPNNIRYIREQCRRSAVPFFFKQWGAWSPHPHHLRRGKQRVRMISGTRMYSISFYGDRLLDGRTHDELPWALPKSGDAQ